MDHLLMEHLRPAVQLHQDDDYTNEDFDDVIAVSF